MFALGRIFVAILGIAFGLGLWTVPLRAAEIRSGDEYRLGQNETVNEDLYVAAGDAAFSGRVGGDASIASGSVVVRGEITQDLLAAGGVVDVLGRIGDDARVMGGNVVFADGVGGDLAVTGGSVRILAGSAVDGDVLIGSGNVALDGTVGGSVRIWGGKVRVGGSVRGPLDITSTETVVIGRGAVVEGDLTYRSPRPIVIEEGAQVRGRVVRQDLPEAARDGVWQDVRDFFVALSIIRLLALVGAGLLGIWAFRAGSEALVSTALSRPWQSLAVGFIVLVVTPALVFVLMLTLVGIVASLFLLLAYFLLLLTAYVYAGILLGVWLFRVYSRDRTLGISWSSAVAGIVLLYVISFIPIIGWLVDFMLFLMVAGGLSQLVYVRARIRPA
jgi:cytoskeletal protein CcmA (bactofilin family)